MRNPSRYRSPQARFSTTRRPALHPLAVACTIGLSATVPTVHAATYIWSTGSFMPGVTAPDPLPAGNVLQINSGSAKTFSGTGLTNQGTVTWNADSLGGSSAVVNNQGLWNLRSDTPSFAWLSGGQPTFTNTGTFRKSAGALNSLGNWKFVNNAGTVDAQVGTLSFNGGGPVFNDDSRFTGAGNVSIDTAANFNDSFVSDSLIISAGTVTGTAARLKAGSVGGGLLRWSGGQLAGDWQIAAGQTLAGLAGGAKQVATSALTNNGNFVWQTDDTLQGLVSGQVVNNGLFEVQGNATTLWTAGGQPTFTNNASGTVRTTGTAQFNAGNFSWVSNGGLFDAAAGTAINFNGGAARFNDKTRFTGAGSIAVNNSARFVGGFTAENLTLVAGTFTGGDGSGSASVAKLSGQVGWTGGQLAGYWQIAGKQTLTGLTGSGKQLNASLTNSGTIQWATPDALQGVSSATLLNKKTFQASASSSLVWTAGGQPTLNNAASGTVKATGGATFGLNNWNIVSDGGLFTTASGSTLLFNGVNNTFNDGTRFTGAGSNTVTGTARFVGTVSSENLRLSSGSFVGGDGTALSRATLTGTTEWLGGDFSGAWTLPASQKLNANAGTAAKRLNGGEFVNAGTLLWNTTDGLSGISSASWVNNGVFEARKSATLSWIAGGQPSLTNNATGTVRANKGATLAMGNFNLISNAGKWEAKTGSSIIYNGGSATFNENTQFIGSGSNVVSNHARFIGLQRSANLTLAGGTLTGGDGTPGSKATLRGTTAWTGGDLAGNWQLESGHTLNAAGAGNRRVNGGVLTNAGSIDWSSNDSLSLISSAVVTNDGSWLLQSDADVTWVAGGQPSLVNNGLLRKTAGSGETSLGSVIFSNNGTLQVDTGSITLPTGFVNGGVLSGSGTFSGPTVGNGGVVSPGNFNASLSATASPFAGGSARLAQSSSAATLTIAGNYSQTSSGNLDMQVTNSTTFDRLLITGNATLAGSLNVGCLGSCSFAAGNTLVLLDATGSLTGSFSSVNFVGLPAGSFNISYDTVNARVLLNVTSPVN